MKYEDDAIWWNYSSQGSSQLDHFWWNTLIIRSFEGERYWSGEGCLRWGCVESELNFINSFPFSVCRSILIWMKLDLSMLLSRDWRRSTMRVSLVLSVSPIGVPNKWIEWWRPPRFPSTMYRYAIQSFESEIECVNHRLFWKCIC